MGGVYVRVRYVRYKGDARRREEGSAFGRTMDLTRRGNNRRVRTGHSVVSVTLTPFGTSVALADANAHASAIATIRVIEGHRIACTADNYARSPVANLSAVLK